jgi:hypothetical protein
MITYDDPGKSLVARVGSALWLRLAGVEHRGRPYDKELDPGRSKRADNLYEVAPDLFLHLELQVRVEVDIGWRMVRYHVLACDSIVRDRTTPGIPKPPRPRMIHWVVYLGPEDREMPSRFCEDGVEFTYNVLDLKLEDPQPYLASGHVWDTIFATLCRGGTSRDIIVRALRQIAALARTNRAEAEEALATLLSLSGLRGAQTIIEEELAHMDLELDVGNSALLRRPIEQARAKGLEEGRVEGRADAVVEALQVRFGPVPEALAEALHHSSAETLSLVLRQSFTATGLAEAVGPELAAHLKSDQA